MIKYPRTLKSHLITNNNYNEYIEGMNGIYLCFLDFEEAFPFGEVELYVELKSMVHSIMTGMMRYGA